jgi:hypothetical protein
LGVRVLRNERVDVRGLFELAGVDDFAAEGMAPGHRQDIPAATAGRDPSKPIVLLAHQPKAVTEASAHGVDLMLSGHVHGGQIVPFNWLVKLEQPYVEGLYPRAPAARERSRYWSCRARISRTAAACSPLGSSWRNRSYAARACRTRPSAWWISPRSSHAGA